MAADEQLTAAFAALRPRMLRIAYGTLGSVAEAEDVVQEAWLRLDRLEDPGEIRDLRAWLSRVVGRLALDALRSARNRRETYVGQWLPEPIVSATGAGEEEDPSDRVTLDESVTMALLVVLEQLTPAERTAFLLHDVFGMPFDEVGEVVGREAPAVRQLASRARRHVNAATPRQPVSRDEHREVVEAFAAACANGDLEALLRTLDDSVLWRSDGGGRVTAIHYPLSGRARVAKALLGFVRRAPRAVAFPLVNGWPGIVLRDADGVLNVMAFTVDGGVITTIESVRNPEKLGHVELL